MSEQPVDIFAYNPITEWNGYIIDFDMPSTDGDTRLTEICLDAGSCLEATKNAMALSYTTTAFIKARSTPVLKIIRTLFGEDTGVTIRTYTAGIAEDGAIHYMSPMVFADMQIYGKNWAFEIVSSKMDIGLYPTFIVTYPDPYGEDGDKVVTISTARVIHTLNPVADPNINSGQIVYGNRPVVGNWDTDGEPYWEINWVDVTTGKCTDNVSTSEWNCENNAIGGFCRQSDYNEPLIISNTNTGSCDDSQYGNKTSCQNGGQIWTSYIIPYETKEITFPNPGTPLVPLKENFCLGNVSGTWVNGGKCLYTHNTYSGGPGNNWYKTTWASTRIACMETTQLYTGWDNYYLMWIEQGNTWTDINAVWRPSYNTSHNHNIGGGGSYTHAIPGTVESHIHYNLKTADNHRKYPENHVPTIHQMAGPNYRMYHSDSGSSWGTGTEVGRSTIPTWITNSYNWKDNDNTYDFCHDPGSNPVDEWSSPSGYYDQGYACEAAGVCSGEWVHTYDQHNQASCESWFLCSDHSLDNNNNSYPCLNNQCCSGGGPNSPTWGWPYSSGWGSNGAPYTCGGAGTCVWNSNFHNHEQYCNWYGGGATTGNGGWVPGYYSWGPNHCGRTWYMANTFTSEGNTWDAMIPYVEVEMPISAEYYWPIMFPPHTFVDTVSSRPLYEYGYTTGLGAATNTTASQSQIRWKPPQTDSSDYNRDYPRPTKFRIYRAPAFYQGLTSNTDFTEQIWKLAGEATTKSDSGWHYFYDTREDMVNEGLGEFQHAYYGITAVWEGWNWKRGYTLKRYDGIGCYDWDIAHPNANADLDNVENATLSQITHGVNSIRISAANNYTTYRASGLFKAPVTGDYDFLVTGDDGIYLWLGANGESISTLVGYRSWYNYVAAVPGLHGPQTDTGTISLTEGEIYPLLAYCGNHQGGYAFYISINYPSGDWNDNSGREWKDVPIDMMPEDMTPGTHGDGQTVEGHWAETTVPAWYTNYP